MTRAWDDSLTLSSNTAVSDPMRPYTSQEKTKITAGAVAAVVATVMLAVIAFGFLLAM